MEASIKHFRTVLDLLRATCYCCWLLFVEPENIPLGPPNANPLGPSKALVPRVGPSGPCLACSQNLYSAFSAKTAQRREMPASVPVAVCGAVLVAGATGANATKTAQRAPEGAEDKPAGWEGTPNTIPAGPTTHPEVRERPQHTSVGFQVRVPVACWLLA